MTQIKICGITREEEITYLNEANVSYAGFVFYEKSKRYISVSDARQISQKLNQDIKKVAVTVTPSEELIRQIIEAGFDILQIHGAFDEALYTKVDIPIWRAVNLSGIDELKRWHKGRGEYEQCAAILIDAGDYGGGKTFGWDVSGQQAWMKELASFKIELAEQDTLLILAGGLTPFNVAEGIRIFEPDAVDVSSGVEEIVDGQRGKRRELVRAFVDAVRDA